MPWRHLRQEMEVGSQLHDLAPLPLWEVPHRIGCLLNPRVGLDSYEEEQNLLLLLRIKAQFLSIPACCLVPASVTLPWHHLNKELRNL
jgi:hypothetical protein